MTKQPYSAPLEKPQVDEIIHLCTVEKMGVKRIAFLTGVREKTVEKILQGRAYRKWTGGRLVNGPRKECIWRHGSLSFYDVLSRNQ